MRYRISLIFAFAIAACSPCEPGDSSCPTPLSVRGQCMTVETNCSVDGVGQWCTADTPCDLGRGQLLTVPLTGLDLTMVPDLFVDYLDERGSKAPLPTHVHAAIDGKEGAVSAFAVAGEPHAAIVKWGPFANAPKELALSFSDGAKGDAVQLSLQFEDAACEKNNAVNCPASP